MHEAFNISNILQLTVQIECIAAHDETLFLGTRQGHLYMYYIVPKDDKPDVSLMRLNKSFSKKAIQQLEIVPDHQLLISLSDNFIQVHDINGINFPVVQQIDNSKGASLFGLNIQHHTTMSGKEVAVIRMCVAVKRRLYLYYWKKPGFVLFENSDLTLKDIPKTLVWCEETICVGYKGEYCLHKASYTSRNYDEFRETVAAAHLRPLRHGEAMKKKVIWNSVTQDEDKE
ncbi:Dynein attachment factor N-terminus [Popillia japonica]|uniref:Dynein attachment factor N-terminus n=1 Tax=Popillia japonica TaxID=7064 RepID=A0AAW1KNJ8_POPJA